MALQFFLAFFGSILGCSIALAVVAKNLSGGFAESGKKPFLYGSFSAIVASGLAYLASYITENTFAVFWYLGGLFLLFGVVYILVFHYRYFQAHRFGSNKVLVGEIIFGLSVILFTVVVFSSLQFFFKDTMFLFYPLLLSSLLFFVPVLVFHAFQAAMGIPDTTYPTWEYPVHNPIELPDPDEEGPRDRILVIGFEIAKTAGDNRKTYFRAKGPETMKLGELFYHFMNEYNEQYSETPIAYLHQGFQPYQWWFCQKPKWYQWQKFYDPELSVREYGIKENTVIVCERAPLSEPIVNPIKQRV